MARLLLVEDDPMILNALTAFLREEGFETETADGQRAALELLSRHSFDLVLLDITLREGNGFDTCRAIKAQSSVPVFFLLLPEMKAARWQGWTWAPMII